MTADQQMRQQISQSGHEENATGESQTAWAPAGDKVRAGAGARGLRAWMVKERNVGLKQKGPRGPRVVHKGPPSPRKGTQGKIYPRGSRSVVELRHQ